MGVVADAWTWLSTGSNWSGESGAWHRLGEHVYVSGVALLLACAIALPIALWLGHLGKGGALAVNISNAGRAIPVFAVLALFMLTPLRSAGYLPTIIALVLFAVPPLLTNAYVGMREVDRAVVEAARGMGMSGGQLFLRVELPLAHPLLMTGLRTAAVQVVATATIASMVGQGGLGRIITAGFNTYNTPQVVAGALLAALLALLVEGALVAADRLLDPRRKTARSVSSASSVKSLSSVKSV
ncbi:ABC transporter permease [Streptomyces lunaelactis]|uniref:ABC transporter permease n=1 Tax=Streptomyces lunaelactis TaxID=1535768 RepID=UPI001584BDF2|nr:ABC transporter permease [Streptomyces lunaelactis]NUK11720.1 ABC transporter permease [Streptomyces lunaelactis]NUK19549.1 ABC transporter permease [Streptomyces lunaelactis]NUK26855.1 ABC transporter permease [Streptomyces lunaelactis]NUK37141.1 ABC transporter permease [Streptomyces lunaelactis]NUK53329.1 ABC transporter permease [Streptomyces lunaelactis]